MEHLPKSCGHAWNEVCPVRVKLPLFYRAEIIYWEWWKWVAFYWFTFSFFFLCVYVCVCVRVRPYLKKGSLCIALPWVEVPGPLLLKR